MESVFHRSLNPITVRETYPIPRINIFNAFLADDTVLMTLDANLAYRHVLVREEYHDKNLIHLPSRNLQLHMDFIGFTKACAISQHAIQFLITALSDAVAWSTMMILSSSSNR